PVTIWGMYGRGKGASVARIVPHVALHYMAYEQYRGWITQSFRRSSFLWWNHEFFSLAHLI
ncbi:hypothetical protein MKW92_028654, partial [Papaver armeniacum]